jgi:hypothetical protein
MASWIEENATFIVVNILLWLFLGWWRYHHLMYVKGKRKHPFFGRSAAYRQKQECQRWHQEYEVAVRSVMQYTHNYDVAARLLNSNYRPGGSLEWAVSKTIQDLIRDRR